MFFQPLQPSAFPAFSVDGNTPEHNFKMLDGLERDLAKAIRIRNEVNHGGSNEVLFGLQQEIQTLDEHILPSVRTESALQRPWLSLKYRSEGVISWIVEKIKTLFRWIGSLFGFKGKSEDSKEKGGTSSSNSNNAEQQKKFDETHQATREQQIKIKELVNELEKEHGEKYNVKAYGEAETLYLKDVNVGVEKDPLTKEKAKAYLEKAAVTFPVVIYAKIGSKEYHELMADPSYGTTLDGGPVDSMGFIKEPSGSSVKDSKNEGAEVKTAIDRFKERAKNIAEEADKNYDKNKKDMTARDKQAREVWKKHIDSVEKSVGGELTHDDHAVIKDKFINAHTIGKFKNVTDEEGLVKELTTIAKQRVASKPPANKSRNEASGPSSMRVSSVRNANLLLTKRGSKVSFEPKAFLTCVRQESLEAKIKQLVKIAEGFINSSDNDIENLGKGAEQSISQVFSARDKVNGFEKEETGYVYHYHMTSPNRCQRIGYSKDRVVRDKVVETISPQDATSLKFSSADMTAALQEIEKFQKEFLKTEKALANEIPSKINSLEKKASDKIANDPHKAKIFFGIVKVIGMFGEIYREISRFNNQLSGIDTSSFEQVK